MVLNKRSFGAHRSFSRGGEIPESTCKVMCVCVLFWGWELGERSVHHILKEGLIPEMVKNPGVDPLGSPSAPPLGWGSLPTT